MKTRITLLLLLISLLAGCTGCPGKFYAPGDCRPTAKASGHIPIIETGSIDADLRRYSRDGYKTIGYSYFSGEYIDAKGFARQARKVKAGLVYAKV